MKKVLLNLTFLFALGTFISFAQTDVASNANGASAVWSGRPTNAGVAVFEEATILANDGVLSTRILSWDLSLESFVYTVTFDQSYSIDKYEMRVGATNGNPQDPLNDFTFEYWDGAIWQIINNVTGNTDPQYSFSFTAVSTNKVRFTATKGYGDIARLIEFMVFEEVTCVGGDEIISAVDNSRGALLSASSIFGIWVGETVDELLPLITVNPSASMQVFENDGFTPVDGAIDIATGMILRTTSCDGVTTKDYNLSINSTNVASGVVPTLETLYVPDYFGVGSTSLDGVTDGVIAASSGRWLFQATITHDVPFTIEFDFGTDKDIMATKLHERFNATDYEIETWNGATWDSQGTVTGVNNLQTINGLSSSIVTIFKFPTPVTTSKFRITFTATLDAGQGYIRVHEMEIFEDTTLSTVDVDGIAKTNFSVYPNPVSGDYINIKSLAPITSAKVYNVLGKQVESKLINKTVNISTLQSGMYFIKINDVQTVKFIKK